MESQFLEKNLSTDKSYTEIFQKVLPFYISIGMTYDQFYDQDVSLAVIYRKAYELKNEHENTQLWLQGMYIYDAISTSIYNAFCRKAGQQAASYTPKPYPMNKKQQSENIQLTVEEERAKAKVWLENWVNAYQ